MDSHRNYMNRVEKGPTQEKGFSGKRSVLLWLPALFLFLIFLSMNSIRIGQSPSTPEKKEAFLTSAKVYKNIKEDLVIDIKWVPETSDCPHGFIQERFGQWAGSHAGCVCQKGVTSKDGKLFDEAHCKKHTDTCKIVKKSHEGKQFSIYKNLKLCTKRISDWSYVNDNEKCKTQWKKCNKNICVKGGQCPVTKMVYAYSIVNKQNPNERSYESLTKVTLAREYDDAPMVNHEVSFSELIYPCITSNKRPRLNKNLHYGLENIQNKGCGVYGDSFDYTEPFLDYDSVENFLKKNGVLRAVDNLPYYWDVFEKTGNVNMYMHQKIMLYNKPACNEYQKVSFNRIEDNQNTLYHLNKTMKTLILILAGIGLLLSIIFIASSNISSKTFSRKFYFIVLFFALVVALCVIVYFAIFIHNYHSDDRKSLEKVSKEHCFNIDRVNELNNDVLEYYKEHGDWNEWIVIFAFVITILFLILMLVVGLLRRKKSLPFIPLFN